jgi:hypothetical protein
MADTFKFLLAGISTAFAGGISIARDLAVSAFFGPPAVASPVRAAEPRRLTIADQWAYLTDIVMGAASRVEEATRCHASATQQLDLAQYALSSLVDELATVMDMGERVRRRATIHVFGSVPLPAPLPIGGAIAA